MVRMSHAVLMSQLLVLPQYFGRDSGNLNIHHNKTSRSPIPSTRACEEHSCTEGDAVQENDTADYLNFLSSEFMARFSAAITSRRRESELKRTFEETLKRRLQKQARSDEFFQIYRCNGTSRFNTSLHRIASFVTYGRHLACQSISVLDHMFSISAGKENHALIDRMYNISRLYG